MNMQNKSRHCWVVVAMALCVTAGYARGEDAATATATKQLSTGSRARHYHRISLLDAAGHEIDPADPNAQPYDPDHTCGKCHTLNSIIHGWHFNATDPTVKSGQAGEPWILADKDSRTQLPLSYRGWPGTFKPEDVGLTRWKFVKLFSGYMPGGGAGTPSDDEIAAAKDPKARWALAGKLSIDCMICHAAGNTYDMEERQRMLADENYKWAPTAAIGLGSVTGTSKALSAPPPSTQPGAEVKLPTLPLKYDLTRFDEHKRVNFDVTRQPSPERCYACHSVREVGPDAPPRFMVDNDVHIRAGMKCTDCHRNDIGHGVVRGFDGEPNPNSVGLSCRGCHIADSEAAPPRSLGGRLGAPRPEHKGIPPLHFKRLACIACHSGPWPGEQTHAVQTSLAHGLGKPSRDRKDDELPLIAAPVFLENSDFEIAPHRMIWPSYWAWEKDGKMQPLAPPDDAKPAIKALSKANVPADAELTNAQIALALTALAAKAPQGAQPAFVHGGKVYRLEGPNKDQAVAHVEHAADPYAWSYAHDVRPKAQSLGVRGCTDCHSTDSAMFFGKLASPLQKDGANLPIANMTQARGGAQTLTWLWSASFAMRPMFKVAAFGGTGLLGAMLMWYGWLGLAGLSKKISQRRSEDDKR